MYYKQTIYFAQLIVAKPHPYIIMILLLIIILCTYPHNKSTCSSIYYTIKTKTYHRSTLMDVLIPCYDLPSPHNIYIGGFYPK